MYQSRRVCTRDLQISFCTLRIHDSIFTRYRLISGRSLKTKNTFHLNENKKQRCAKKHTTTNTCCVDCLRQSAEHYLFFFFFFLVLFNMSSSRRCLGRQDIARVLPPRHHLRQSVDRSRTYTAATALSANQYADKETTAWCSGAARFSAYEKTTRENTPLLRCPRVSGYGQFRSRTTDRDIFFLSTRCLPARRYCVHLAVFWSCFVATREVAQENVLVASTSA